MDQWLVTNNNLWWIMLCDYLQNDSLLDVMEDLIRRKLQLVKKWPNMAIGSPGYQETQNGDQTNFLGY